jgi:hypothetical protein
VVVVALRLHGHTKARPMDSSRPSSPLCNMMYYGIPRDDHHPWACACAYCSPFSKTVILNDEATKEPSVGKVGGDDASVAETQGLPPSADTKDGTDSDEGRLHECGTFPIGSPPRSDETPSVHFFHHYFMVDGRVSWRQS